MAHRELVVLAVLLSCLILLQQILMTTMADYRYLHHQRRLLFAQLAGTIQRRRPRREKTSSSLNFVVTPNKLFFGASRLLRRHSLKHMREQ